MALKNNPDKKNDGIKKSDEETKMENAKGKEAFQEMSKQIWLKIKKAYDILMDEDKKKAYDSSLPFDNSLPKEEEITDVNFYKIFEPVFQRNAIWSSKKPVPTIGDSETSIKKAKKFY